MNKPEFTDEQMEYLKSILSLSCCHITGMHDPQHYARGEYICSDQKAEAFDNACNELGIIPKIRSKSNCWFCNNNPSIKDMQIKDNFIMSKKEEQIISDQNQKHKI